MAEVKVPRFMISAPGSGSGKTTIVCGLLKALMEKGLSVAAFKSGPDYIDPMFHSRVIGANPQSGSVHAGAGNEPLSGGKKCTAMRM